MWVPIPAVFLLIILMGVLESIFSSTKLDMLELVILAAGGIGIGVIVWLPSAIICLFIERIAINERTTKAHIKLLLFAEALIPFLIFMGIMGDRNGGRDHFEILITSFCILMIAQLARWFYLKRKGKLYKKRMYK